MDLAKKMLMQQIIRIVAPTSPAYGNTSHLPFVKQESMASVIGGLQIGDIIFTKTNNSVYQLGRKFLDTDFDHVSVVINKHQVIHISPPIISKIEIQRIIHKSREPVIFRVNFSNKQSGKQTFLSILQNFIGEKYNQYAIPQIFKRQFSIRLQKIALNALDANKSKKKSFEFSLQTMKYSKICSEAILYAICRGNDELNGKIEEYVEKETGYSQLGYILPQELKSYLQANNIEIVYNGVLSRENKTDKTLIDHIQDFSISDKLDKLGNFGVYTRILGNEARVNLEKMHTIMKNSGIRLNLQNIMKMISLFQTIGKNPSLFSIPLLCIQLVMLLISQTQTNQQNKKKKILIQLLFLLLEFLVAMSMESATNRNQKISQIKPKL